MSGKPAHELWRRQLTRLAGSWYGLCHRIVKDDLDANGHANDWWRKCKIGEDWAAMIQVLLDVPSP